MADKPTAEEVTEFMFKMVEEAFGKKKYKPMDLTKYAQEQWGGKANCPKSVCKEAIKNLVDSGRCVYTYFGGTYLEIPHKEGAAN